MTVLSSRQRRSALAAVAAAAVAIPAGLAAAPATAAPVTAAPAALQASTAAQLEAAIVAQVNAYRAANGVAPLTRNSGIDSVARGWSQNQADRGTMSHNPRYADQMPAGASAWAENVAYLQGYSVSEMAKVFVDDWIGSPGHRRNILDANMTHTGVGIAQNAAGEVYATQNFGRYAGGISGDRATASPTPKPAPSSPAPKAAPPTPTPKAAPPTPAPKAAPLTPAPKAAPLTPAPSPTTDSAPAPAPQAPAPQPERPTATGPTAGQTPAPAPSTPASPADESAEPTPEAAEGAATDHAGTPSETADHPAEAAADGAERAEEATGHESRHASERLNRFQRMVLEILMSVFTR
ncbi:CAP domain-containing protein [Georgenia ruanii]|uniref:CAP domain-containing protein n=1 Tax=Georgenia ruanii TaxID=348442 RepID=UPI001264AD74|nr:CAP domain-containing protein [Georgenia ruanii]